MIDLEKLYRAAQDDWLSPARRREAVCQLLRVGKQSPNTERREAAKEYLRKLSQDYTVFPGIVDEATDWLGDPEED